MKSSIYWDITLYSLLQVNRRFGGTCRLHLQHSSAGFLLGLFFDPEDGGNMFIRNVCLLSTLHGIISQKTEPSITIAERTSDPNIYI
jgi:hypothetical protein